MIIQDVIDQLSDLPESVRLKSHLQVRIRGNRYKESALIEDEKGEDEDGVTHTVIITSV